MQYALGTDATTAPTTGYTTSIPAATDAGTYYVWYKVAGDDSHNDTDAQCVTATIQKATLAVAAEAQTKTYGQADPALTYKAIGLVDGDELTGALARAVGEKADVYAINQGTLTAGGNYEIEFTGAALTILPARDGAVAHDVVVEDGAPAVTSSNLAALAEGLLTADEKSALVDGAAAHVWLQVRPADPTSMSDAAALRSAASGLGATPGVWLDITLHKQVTGLGEGQVHETTTKVAFTVTIPENLRKAGRTFYLIRCHDGETTVLAQGTSDTLSAASDRFSTYLIVYKDAAATTNAATETTATTAAKRGSVPQTRDALASAAVLAAALGTAGHRLHRRRSPPPPQAPRQAHCPLGARSRA